MAPRDYARLHWDWHEDEVIEAIADDPRCKGVVMALWPVLIADTKKASDVEMNPTGVLGTTWSKLAAKVRRDVKEVARCMDLLVEGELATVTPGRVGVQLVELVNWSKWQAARRSKAEQQQVRRDRELEAASRENVSERGDDVGSQSDPFTETETEKEEPGSLRSPSSPSRDDRVQEVFDYWCKVEAATGGQGSPERGSRKPKLTNDRRSKIRARLAEGIDVDDLKRAIAFYAKDPHHAGDNDRGTRFTDLTTTLKNGSKVEQGVAGYHARRNGPDGGGSSGIDMGYER